METSRAQPSTCMYAEHFLLVYGSRSHRGDSVVWASRYEWVRAELWGTWSEQRLCQFSPTECFSTLVCMLRGKPALSELSVLPGWRGQCELMTKCCCSGKTPAWWMAWKPRLHISEQPLAADPKSPWGKGDCFHCDVSPLEKWHLVVSYISRCLKWVILLPQTIHSYCELPVLGGCNAGCPWLVYDFSVSR